VAEGEIAAVVFPTITGTPDGLSLRPLAPAAAAHRLEASLLGSGPGRNRSDLFRLPGAPPAPGLDALRARCRRLADAVPCLECRLGETAYLDPGSAAGVLQLAG
jgi:hypothetical protein